MISFSDSVDEVLHDKHEENDKGHEQIVLYGYSLTVFNLVGDG